MTLDPLQLLPHRYPFLLLDRIIEVEPGKRAVALKRVTGAEWSGAYPTGVGTAGAMPQLLLVEALAQLSAAIIVYLVEGSEGAIGYFTSMNHVRCRGAARPGDDVRLEVELKQFKRGICRTRGTAWVRDQCLVRADLTTIVRPAASTS